MNKEQRQFNPPAKPGQTGLLQHQRLRGDSITCGSVSVTPVSRRISLRLPGWLGKDKGQVFIFQQPAAVIVKRHDRAGTRTQTIPIYDLTHIILVSMFGLTAVVLYVLMRANRRT